MTCDEYYKTHSEPTLESSIDRCNNRVIEAATAQAVSLLGASTTLFGVINLFITNWSIKRFGIKRALLIQIFWPAVRLAVQNIGVQTGAGAGIIIVQCSQVITIVGGPAGYLLTLNSFVAEVVEPSERTTALGRLQGCALFGVAVGYLAGGLLSDWFNIIAPFRVTLALFLLCCVYGSLFLPSMPPAKDPGKTKSLSEFFGPLKMFAPRKWVLPDGRVQMEYGVLLLGLGVFFGVLATDYIPVLLQMYSTDVFGFGTTENGYLVALNSLIRGCFLTLVFPKIISAGRKWLDKREQKDTSPHLKTDDSGIPDLPTDPQEFAAVPGLENEDQEPIQPPRLSDEQESFHFDLLFTKYSLVVDGILTGSAMFTRQGWQMYLVAVLLPLASGTAPAAKGTILQMCPADQRTEALSAISLVEMMARLSTSEWSATIYEPCIKLIVYRSDLRAGLLGFCRHRTGASGVHVQWCKHHSNVCSGELC